MAAGGTPLANAFVRVNIDPSQIHPQLTHAFSSITPPTITVNPTVNPAALSSSLTAAAGHAGTAGTAAGSAFGAAAVAGIAGAGIVGAVGKIFSTGLDEQKDYEAGLAKLESGLQSTGNVAGLTADQMEDLASSIQDYSGQTDDSIVAAEQLLLTFTNIKDVAGQGNDIFTQTTKIAADMAARLGGDAASSAIQLGKALNDPIKGVTALSRVGVSFTDEQKNLIKTLVDSGNVMGAQKVILAELNKEFGGSAKAVGESLPGQLERGKRAFEDLSQSIVAAIAPLVEGLVPAVNDFIKIIGPVLEAAVTTVVGIFHDLVSAGKSVGEFFQHNTALAAALGTVVVASLIPAMGALAATIGRTLLVGLLNLGIALTRTVVAITSLNPAVLGVAAAVGAAVAAYSFFSKSNRETKVDVESLTQAVDKQIKTLNSGDLQNTILQQLADFKFTKAGDINGVDYLQKYGVSVSDLVKQLADPKNGNSFEKFRNDLDATAKAALLQGDTLGKQDKVFAGFQKALEDTNPAVRQFALLFKALLSDKSVSPDTINAITKAFGNLGGTIDEARSKTSATADVQKDLAKSTADVGDATDDTTKALGDEKTVAEALSDRIDAVTKSTNEFFDTQSSVIESTDAFQKTLRHLGENLDANSKSLTDNSDAGATNRAAIIDLVEQAEKAATAQAKATGRQEDYTAVLYTAIPAIKEQAIANGLSRDEVDRLIDSLVRLPPNKAVPVTAPGAETAGTQVTELNNLINGLTDKTITLGVQATGFNGLGTDDLRAIALGHHAAGGHIRGPGTGTSDSILAWLSNGEYVIPERVVSKLGVGYFDGLLNRYANGGSVTINTSATGTYDVEEQILSDVSNFTNVVGQAVQAALQAQIAAISGAGVAGPGQSFNKIIQFAQRGPAFTTALPGLDRGGHSWHEAGDAIDFSGGDLDAMASFWYQYAPFLLEEIHSPSWYVKNGAVVGAGFYGPDIVAQHYNHVHIAASPEAMDALLGTHDNGGMLESGKTAVNMSGKPEAVLTNEQWKALAALTVSVAQLAKNGTEQVQGLLVKAIKPAVDAIGVALKDGSPSQTALAGRLKQADANLYFASTVANADGKVSLQEFAAVKHAADVVKDLTKQLTTLNTANEKVIDRLKDYVSTQQQFRDNLRSTLSDGSTFGDIIGHSGTIGDVKTLLSDKLAGIRTYVGKIRQLDAQGWSSVIIREVADLGVAGGTQAADLLLGASAADRKSIISATAGLDSSILGAANTAARLTDGPSGLTNNKAILDLQKALYSPGANVDYWIKQAERDQRLNIGAAAPKPDAPTRTAPMIQGETIIFGRTVDFRQELERARFLENASF